MVINWGATKFPERVRNSQGTVLNSFERVNRAGNKLLAFRDMENNPNVRIPDFTTDRSVAEAWINDGLLVVCRTSLRGHSGHGIVLSQTIDELVDAPLYVKYVKKLKEFRVHIGGDTIIDVQEKRRRNDYEGETNNQVRNHHTGWVYCRENIVEPTELRDMARSALLALGLDFGAVDIIYNQHRDECTVLEVNTAPGLEGTTLTSYTNYFTELLNGR